MTAAAAPLRIRRPPSRSTPDIRVWAVNGTKWALLSSPGERSRSPCSRLASTTMERPSGVSSARLESCAASASSAGPQFSTGMNSAAWRLPRVMVPVLSSRRVFTSPAASTARPDIASTLCCTRRSMPAMPMADSRAPMVVGIRQTSSATRTITDCSDAGVGRERLQGRRGGQEHDRQAGQQDVERDLVGRLLPAGPLDQRDHPVDEALARLRGDHDDDPVREHLGAPGDRAPVATRLADDRGRLTGDGRLVDAGDALDHIAVAGDRLAGGHGDPVAEPQRGGRHVLAPAAGEQSVCGGLGLGPTQGGRLRLAPTFGHGLGEVGEDDGQPEPDDDGPGEAARVRDRRDRGVHGADLDDEHDRVAHHHPRVELAQGVRQRGDQHPRVEQTPRHPGGRRGR